MNIYLNLISVIHKYKLFIGGKFKAKKMWSIKNKIILSICLIFTISMGGLLFYLLDPNISSTSISYNRPSDNPYHINSYPYCLEDDFLMSGIDLDIRYDANLSFVNHNQGGMTGYFLYFQNNFHYQSNSRYLRIKHNLAITSLIEKTVYTKEIDTWIEQLHEEEWRNPEEFNIFTNMDYSLPSGYIYDNLVIEQNCIEENHKWLDLGIFLIGPFKQVVGYNLASISIINTNAKMAYYGLEEVVNNTKTLMKVKEFIIRDYISWEVYQCRLFGWKLITSKTYYLGNYMLEAFNGIERSIGIDFVPLNL